MYVTTWRWVGCAAIALMVLLPTAAAAQSAIAGAVKDSSGAVMPGVTVEAASPALIEKVRTVVSDDRGLFKIVDLRPGTYAVTFTLPGFDTVKHEGIELATNFTATVNAEMRVGSLEETITVSGGAPVVDVQNVVQQRVINKDVIAAIPSARTFQQLAGFIPGVAIRGNVRPSGQDVGGTAGEASTMLGVHGSRPGDMQIKIDGMLINNVGTVAQTGILVDIGSVQEVGYELGAAHPESQTGSVQVNMIGKSGGNRFSGSLFTGFSNHSLQSDNTTSALTARGLGAINHLDKVFDANPSFGGPIQQDKLWFFVSGRYWGLTDQVAGIYYNLTPNAPVYTPDTSRPAVDDSWFYSGGVRLTSQLTPKNRFTAYFLDVNRCLCHSAVGLGTAPVSPEATRQGKFPLDYLAQAGWTAPVTNRLLFEAGMLIHRLTQTYDFQPEAQAMSITDSGTGLRTRASSGGTIYTQNWVYNYKAAVSYVTGSHAAKAGFYLQQGHSIGRTNQFNDTTLTFLNGSPRSITVYATPLVTRLNIDQMLAFYAQDQWTLKKLTLNLGLRYDHQVESVPAQHLDATQFLPARDYPGSDNIPNWKDLSPRLGASYDVFGNGKTAVKVSLSRYVGGETSQFASANNPVSLSVNSATRTWTDSNLDFIPQPTEFGALSPSTFGQTNIVTRYDDALRAGWGVRPYNWETAVGLQHTLFPRVSADVSYHRRWFGNFTVTDNLSRDPSDYDTYCVTAPVDSRLPGGGGYPVCGLYDINPTKFSAAPNNVVTFASKYGKTYENFNAVDLNMTARLDRGMLVSGGVSYGKRTFDNCDTIGKVDNAAVVGTAFTVDYLTVAAPSKLYCHQETPFQPTLKILVSLPLPWAFQVSGTVQSVPGAPITATYVATSAQTTLARNFSAGATATANVELIAPGSMYDDRTNQLDVRLSKILKFGRARLQANLDLYNALNASPVLVSNTQYGTNGARWLVPTYVLPGRLLKFGFQFDF